MKTDEITKVCNEMKKEYKEKRINKADICSLMGCLQYHFEELKEMLEMEEEEDE